MYTLLIILLLCPFNDGHFPILGFISEPSVVLERPKLKSIGSNIDKLKRTRARAHTTTQNHITKLRDYIHIFVVFSD